MKSASHLWKRIFQAIGIILMGIVATTFIVSMVDPAGQNHDCMDSTDAIDVTTGFVMGDTACRLKKTEISQTGMAVEGQYYFECASGNHRISAHTNRVAPWVCNISGIRWGWIQD